MSMAKCKECGKEISDKATACPHCGAKPYKASGCFVVILAALAIFGTIGVMSSKNAPAPVPPIAVSVAPPTPRPSPIPLHPDVVKARTSVEKIDGISFCRSMGKELRKTKGANIDYQAAIVWRAETKEGITPAMLGGIRSRTPVIGMNLCAVVAALGQPNRTNRSVGRFGERHQLVYSDRGIYVYLDNYIVTSWQD